MLIAAKILLVLACYDSGYQGCRREGEKNGVSFVLLVFGLTCGLVAAFL